MQSEWLCSFSPLYVLDCVHFSLILILYFLPFFFPINNIYENFWSIKPPYKSKFELNWGCSTSFLFSFVSFFFSPKQYRFNGDFTDNMNWYIQLIFQFWEITRRHLSRSCFSMEVGTCVNSTQLLLCLYASLYIFLVKGAH